nr:MAG TPA: hypothetical protein [Caudoviricetes sp.]
MKINLHLRRETYERFKKSGIDNYHFGVRITWRVFLM